MDEKYLFLYYCFALFKITMTCSFSAFMTFIPLLLYLKKYDLKNSPIPYQCRTMMFNLQLKDALFLLCTP